MQYYASFFIEDANEQEVEVEVIFEYDEETETENFWGYPVAIPPTGQLTILEVFKDGKASTSYEGIEEDIFSNDLHWADVPKASPKKQQLCTQLNKPTKTTLTKSAA